MYVYSAVLRRQHSSFIYVLHFIGSELLQFEELHKIDTELTVLASNILEAVREKSRLGKNQNEGSLQNADIAGSASEGGMVARIFRPVNENLAREVEADIQFTLFEIPPSHKNIVEDIPGRKGFVKLCVEDDVMWSFSTKGTWKIKREKFEIYREKICMDGYLNPYFLKKELARLLKIEINSRCLMESLLTASVGEKVQLIIQPPKITKATVEGGFDVYISGKHITSAAWDVATVIRIKWWPDIAREWIFRDRNWPSQLVVTNMTKMTYLITKPSDEQKSTLELRYSFAHLERELALKRSSDQGYIYLIFKSMFYKWIKPIDSEAISSFVAKTIMFWASEKYPPESKMWQKASSIYAVTYLFRELLSALEKKHLPYYFIPCINIIERVNDTLRTKLISKTEDILCEVERFVPADVSEVVTISQEILVILKAVNQLLKFFDKKLMKKIRRKFLKFHPKNHQSSEILILFTIAAIQEVLFYFMVLLIEVNRFCLIHKDR